MRLIAVVLVLRQVHPDLSISFRAGMVLNSLVNDMFERIATEASSTCFSSRITIDVVILMSYLSFRACRLLQKVDHLLP